jgi:hypothetical protein
MENTVKKIFAVMVLEYGDKFNTTPERMAMWVNMLEGMDSSTAMAAALHLISVGGPFPPTVGELRRKMLQISQGAITRPSPYQAWKNVCEYVAVVNCPPRYVPFGEDREKRQGPAITNIEKEALESIGGGYYLYNSTNRSIDMSHFIKAYTALLEKSENEAIALPSVKRMLDMNAPALPAPSAPEPKPKQIESAPVVNAEEVEEMIRKTKELLSTPPEWDK